MATNIRKKRFNKMKIKILAIMPDVVFQYVNTVNVFSTGQMFI